MTPKGAGRKPTSEERELIKALLFMATIPETIEKAFPEVWSILDQAQLARNETTFTQWHRHAANMGIGVLRKYDEEALVEITDELDQYAADHNL